MKATYKGPEIAVEVFGIVFPRGQAVDVADLNAATKLKNHPEFDTAGDLPSPPPVDDKKAKK